MGIKADADGYGVACKQSLLKQGPFGASRRAFCVGGAVIPYLLGALADKVGIQHAFILPVICYLYIAWFGMWGSKPKRTAAA